MKNFIHCLVFISLSSITFSIFSQDKAPAAPAPAPANANAKNEQPDAPEIIEGKLKSSALIDIENDIDYLEKSFVATYRAVKGSPAQKDWDEHLIKFRENCKKLQTEANKNNIAEAKAMNMIQYPDLLANAQLTSRSSYFPDSSLNFPVRMYSTSRNNRDGKYYTECDAEDLLADERARVSRNIPASKANKRHKEDNEKLRSELIKTRNYILIIRKNIKTLEAAGYWNTIKRNGETYKACTFK